MSLVLDEAMIVLEGLELTEEELATIAIKILEAQGYALKIFGPRDVERLLESAEDNDGAGRDIAKIVDHVVKSDDWGTMADVTDGDEQNLYALIDGARNDHPEWFGSE